MIAIRHVPDAPADTDCSICLDPIATNEAYGHVTNHVPHVFHRDCIVRLYISGRENATFCPLCRVELGEGELNLSLSERAQKVANYTKQYVRDFFLVLGVAVILASPLIYTATILCAIKTRDPVFILATCIGMIVFKILPPLLLQIIND